MTIPPVRWSWRNAAHGVVLALPAVAAALHDPAWGMPLAVGVLPAAALGLRSTRRERAMVMLVGAVAGLSIFAGSLFAPFAALAVAAVFALCVTVALFAADPAHRLGPLVLMLGLPLYGAGLSESSWTTGLVAGALIIAGSIYGWLTSLVWPVGEPAARAPHRAEPHRAEPHRAEPHRAAPRSSMLAYGIQIGLAGSAAAAIGFALGVDHPGWACTAALLVSRPDRRQLDARGWGRSISVIAGALVACGIMLLAPSNVAIGLLLLVTLSVAAATAGSRWYIFPFFSTIIVLSMLLLGETETPAHWLLERTSMTLVGVALALLSAWVVPAVAATLRSRTSRRD